MAGVDILSVVGCRAIPCAVVERDAIVVNLNIGAVAQGTIRTILPYDTDAVAFVSRVTVGRDSVIEYREHLPRARKTATIDTCIS